MILADTSVWIDHFRRLDRDMESLLESGQVMTHPFVVGELACGDLPRRADLLETLDALPGAVVAEDDEVRKFIERHRLFGKGVGFVDFHLLVSTVLSPDASLWTADRRLGEIAAGMKIGHRVPMLH